MIVPENSPAPSATPPANAAPRFNSFVLAAIRKMPTGGSFAATTAAQTRLAASHQIIGDRIYLKPQVAQPSYCSGATYLVLLQALADLQQSGQLQLTPQAAAALQVKSQPDGEGVWGRWNANGPGTACLVHELGAGRSFTDIATARPGDFLKIFWNDAVGKNERGHLVVFLRTEEREGVPGVLFWSSNKPGGYGEKWVPNTKIIRTLFTRIEHPSAFGRAAEIEKRDTYLSQMLTRDSSFAEALKMSGVR